MRSGFWKADWFLGLAVVFLFALLGDVTDLLPGLERKAYDLALASAPRVPSDQVAIIAIDKQSIDNIGRWPWPRDTHAKMVDLLAQARARAVGYLVFFSEPENERINRTLGRLMDAAPPESPILALLKEAESDFNTDRRLAASMERAGNVVLPLLFVLESPRGRPDRGSPPFLAKNAIAADAGSAPVKSSAVAISVLEPLGNAAAALGHLNVLPDVDGAARSEALAVAHYGEVYPSLAATLYQLLAGRLPFDGESMAQLMFRIANEPPADIRSSSGVPEGLVRFLARALAKNADERFQTGEHFAGALRSAMGAPARVDLEI